MHTVDENQIEKLLVDIASIKDAINENKTLIRQLLLPVHFRIISFIAGIVTIVLSALFYYLLEQYGRYGLIPSTIRMFSLGLVVVACLAMGLLKRVLWMKSLKQIDSSFTFGVLLKSIYSFQVLHVWVPIGIGILLLSSYFYFIELPRYIVTAVAFGLGLIYNSMGSVTRIWQYMVSGYWMMVAGALPLIFVDVSALIFLALSLGCSMLIFAFLSGTSKKREE